jgi:hypothetical protein
VAREIMRQTDNGTELVKWALERWRNPELSDDARERAHAWLADRGLGKAVANVEIHAQLTQGEPDADDDEYDQLSIEQLRALVEADQEYERRRAAIMARDANALPSGDDE